MIQLFSTKLLALTRSPVPAIISKVHSCHCHRSLFSARFSSGRFKSAISERIFRANNLITVRFYSIQHSVPLDAIKFDMASAKVGRLSPNDPSSFSNPENARAENINLKWNVDFERKVISGSANYILDIVDEKSTYIIFDIKDITVLGVFNYNGKKLEYSVGETVSTFGQPLKITLPLQRNPQEKLEIQVKYETAPNKCSALQWLDKEQTAGKKFPYLFSQCEAIHARSLLPCQDTPSTKAAYSAEVTAQKELQVLMSAVRSGEPDVVDSNQRRHTFVQKVPIPSYLIAIVAGQIESRRLGPRTEVWAEKQFLDDAAIDFADTEKMLQAAESVCGEYVWGVYDILVLPPSFPFGGMENPCLTFATPTLLAGDKSLANVIAHEIAHSWTGNLVTNKTFEHFWLNEGFTVFAERKIVGRLDGEAARQFASIQGLKDLKDCIDTLKPDNPLTNLVVNLDGVDPDDAFSSVPYEKGYAFLYYLEQKVGGPSVFEPFFKTYIANNRYKSIDTNEFKSQFIDYFTKNGNESLINDIEWDKWFSTPGMPLIVSKYDTTLSQVCVDLKNRWLTWDGASGCPFDIKDLQNLSSSQRIEFLAELVAHETPLPLTKLKAMQECYNFNSVRNSEIRFRWLRLCIKGKWVEQLPLALKFVTEQGRMKFVRPLYRDMYAWVEARQQAIENFQKNRSSMMYVSAYTVAKDLHLAQ